MRELPLSVLIQVSHLLPYILIAIENETFSPNLSRINSILGRRLNGYCLTYIEVIYHSGG